MGLEGRTITPDLFTFGKVVGGGMPLAALGGRPDLLDLLAPLGPVYQAGTLSGNPLATAAGIATLKLADEAVYAHVDRASLQKDIEAALATEAGVLWLTDKRGRQVAIPSSKVAYVEIGSPEDERRIGFGAG